MMIPIGEDVIQKLNRHKVNTRYMKKVKNGMGTWLAVFDHKGDVGCIRFLAPGSQTDV